MKTKTQYIVTKKIGGTVYDCRLAPRQETGLGSALSPKMGILVAAPVGREVAVFPGEKSAWRAVFKAQKTRLALLGTMVDGMAKLRPVIEYGEFSLRTFQQ